MAVQKIPTSWLFGFYSFHDIMKNICILAISPLIGKHNNTIFSAIYSEKINTRLLNSFIKILGKVSKDSEDGQEYEPTSKSVRKPDISRIIITELL